MSETYVAIHLDGIQEDDVGSFANPLDAWDYIKEHCLCRFCKNELEYGYTIDNGDVTPCVHPWDTSCGNGWDVLSLSEYKTCTDRRTMND